MSVPSAASPTAVAASEPGAKPNSASAPAQVSAPGSAPTQADLLDFVRRTAADTELVASLPLDPEGRTWVRLEGPGGSEAWLIGWPPGRAPAGTTTPTRPGPS